MKVVRLACGRTGPWVDVLESADSVETWVESIVLLLIPFGPSLPAERPGPSSAAVAAGAHVGRGHRYTALFDLRTDERQEHELSAEAPEQLKRLSRALADRLREAGAPAEQLTRLGLDELGS